MTHPRTSAVLIADNDALPAGTVRAVSRALALLKDGQRADVEEVVGMLTSNLEKIAEHGRRADGIVKSMLEHSRGASGERRTVDINMLVEEALNLAYHAPVPRTRASALRSNGILGLESRPLN